jgi:hypothetical protein
MTEDDKEREERIKQLFTSRAKRAIDLRSKDREFHGLEREFRYHQKQMVADYERSKDIKHPRDVGDAREEILRTFLTGSGHFPSRYGVSQNKARAASTTGHISAEIDILFYDSDDSIRLMRREGGYEVFPVESVYGVIQVKSRLNKNEIRGGLENIASFKRLERIDEPKTGISVTNEDKSSCGFGLLFAYDSDLEWLDIIREIESFAEANPNKVWCNAVFILNKGVFLHGDDSAGYKLNPHLERVSKLQMYGLPDREGLCLYDFFSSLLLLLSMTEVALPDINRYFRLPFVAGTRSYVFTWGSHAEIGHCEEHGDFQRKISEENLAKVVETCRKTQPMNWIRATDIAYGRPSDNYEAYARQPGDVFIYNPKNLPFSDILVMDTDWNEGKAKALAFDSIDTDGMVIYVPYFYTVTEGIISDCPQCQKRAAKLAKEAL